MSIHVALTHETTYRYDQPVGLTPHVIRLRPAPHTITDVLSYSLRVSPGGHFLNWQQDPHGNWLARVMFPEPVDHLTVAVDLVADIRAHNPFDFFLEPDAERVPFVYDPDLSSDLAPYLRTSVTGDLFEALVAEQQAILDESARQPDEDGLATINFLVNLNQQLADRIGYVVRMEPGTQEPEETLHIGKGSCRDTGWLLVHVLRRLGLAARFVSGYLIQLKPDVKSLDGPSGTEKDFTDLHAWAEVYLPGAGWIGMDPTSGLLTGEGHIPLAATAHYKAAAPISGALLAAREVSFNFKMEIKRILEQPRVTLPYTDAQWAAIDALGHAVDEKLTAGDVRLTQGGEPTFVAIDHPEEPEWQTAAVGATKLPLAESLIHRLRARFAPGALLHVGQGKWYPGESLPRWALTLIWRTDGETVWPDPPPTANAALSQKDAEAFTHGLAARLGVDGENVITAYEDAAQFLFKEQQLPVNVTPEDNRLANPEDRARIASVFNRGLDKPRGCVLPIQAWQGRDERERRRWISERWPLRRGHLFLAPGDSPMGLRLPLDSLPHVDAAVYPYYFPQDPFATRDPLPPPKPQASDTVPNQASRDVSAEDTSQDVQEQSLVTGEYSGERPVRTALCAEVRDGILWVFMPPTEDAEDYLALMDEVRSEANERGLPVMIEGYLPPPDPRLTVLKVTPDPGVIEVNVQPAASWPELRSITETLYEEAHLNRLGTETFLIDGRHVGTGGGNHMVLGGARAVDSPFLRRPDLLGSLVRFWQNHPSLSYLFAGLFIGPTSQAPRVDEAQDSILYELGIAVDMLTKPEAAPPPWQVDRILRNLLVDVTGNTHRAEICIDKLYSPDGPTGRLGLVEFRSFEMPPHVRMSLVQQLLLRALVAGFWESPYTAPLIRWGAALHDRFMLPHYLWEDMKNVIEYLDNYGFYFDIAWFLPHWTFRFPQFGTVQVHDSVIELRGALEPWPVLGEEPGGGGTVRFVDSSVERLQVSISNHQPGRYVLACNGRAVPLQATTTPGTWVAGVKFRAWQPASALHPTIAPHVPLVFDLVDQASGRSLGGCTYWPAHPGGRNYETRPVNGLEAEGRRLARFQPLGHTPGPMSVPPEPPNPAYAATLDLRWHG